MVRHSVGQVISVRVSSVFVTLCILFLVLGGPFSAHAETEGVRPREGKGEHVLQLQSCDVTFKAGWLEGFNGSRRSPREQLSVAQFNALHQRLTAACNAIWEGHLSSLYRMLEALPSGSQRSLVVTPQVRELSLAAPDVDGAGWLSSRTHNPVVMTMAIRIHDQHTGETLYNVTERRHGNRVMAPVQSDHVANESEFRRVLSRWSAEVVDGFGSAL